MTEKQPYSYTILRYVHDVTTGEFVNIGVVLYCPVTKCLDIKIRHTIGRIKDMFPDFDRKAYRSAIAAVERGVKSVARDIGSSGFLLVDGNAATLAHRALPVDYSSLQWSPPGVGLTRDVAQTLAQLFDRFISRYDSHGARRKTDDDVWRPVRERLDEKHIGVAFEKKVISGELDDITFERTWRNGTLHAYEPLSLDLADADEIKGKARRWRGHLAAVSDGIVDDFKLYFILGKPQAEELMPAYESAKAILARAPGTPEVYEEDEVEMFVSSIEDEYRSHLQLIQG